MVIVAVTLNSLMAFGMKLSFIYGQRGMKSAKLSRWSMKLGRYQQDFVSMANMDRLNICSTCFGIWCACFTYAEARALRLDTDIPKANTVLTVMY